MNGGLLQHGPLKNGFFIRHSVFSQIIVSLVLLLELYDHCSVQSQVIDPLQCDGQ
jgi:hypothetical protein